MTAQLPVSHTVKAAALDPRLHAEHLVVDKHGQAVGWRPVSRVITSYSVRREITEGELAPKLTTVESGIVTIRWGTNYSEHSSRGWADDVQVRPR